VELTGSFLRHACTSLL